MQCKKCGSENVVKNGRTKHGHQQYHCRECGVYTTTDTQEQKRQAQMELVERLHSERVSQRGIARVTGVSRPTIIAWLRKKAFRPIGKTLTPMMGRPEIEIDEQWSYVGSRQQQVWTWTAVERGSCRVVGFAVGERSEAACRELWQSLPDEGAAGKKSLSIAELCLRGAFPAHQGFVCGAGMRVGPAPARNVLLPAPSSP
jgi:insertion element IS1 protein InsB